MKEIEPLRKNPQLLVAQRHFVDCNDHGRDSEGADHPDAARSGPFGAAAGDREENLFGNVDEALTAAQAHLSQHSRQQRGYSEEAEKTRNIGNGGEND